MKQNTAQFITRTGILLALCVVLQLAMPAALTVVKGPAVNVVLLIAAIAVGLPSGLIVALINPLFVFLLAPPAPMKLCPQIVLVVMLGNAVLVVVAALLYKYYLGIPALVSAALAKTAVMVVATTYVIVPFFGAKLVAKGIVETVQVMFGIGQLSTALMGGAVFFVIWQVLKHVPAFAKK